VNGFLAHDITKAIIKMPKNKILFFILYFLLETNLGFFYAPMKCNYVKSLYNINVLSPFNFIESKESLPAFLPAIGRAGRFNPYGNAPKNRSSYCSYS
jgi:hypothetical protein